MEMAVSVIYVVIVRLRSWFVSVYVSRLEIAEFPDGVLWSAPYV